MLKLSQPRNWSRLREFVSNKTLSLSQRVLHRETCG